MKNIIIFDFNRTIYDPDKKRLVWGARKVLKILYPDFKLALVSAAKASRIETIDELNLKSYFAKIVVSRTKSEKEFFMIVNELSADRKKSFIIGDRVKSEIKIGNKLGLKTVWLKKGMFADEIPENDEEKPTYTIKSLVEVLKIIAL